MTPEEQAAADEASKVEEAEILKKEEETVSKEQYDTEVARLDAEKEKWKHRFQKNEKKYDEAKKSTWPVDKEYIKSVVQEVYGESEQKNKLFSMYPDAKENLPQIEKLKAEKGLDWEEAYKLVKFDELNDPAYQARQRQWRIAINGSIERAPIWEDEMLKSMVAADPRLAKK